MKTKFVLATCLILLIIGCEKNNPSKKNFRDKIKGHWYVSRWQYFSGYSGFKYISQDTFSYGSSADTGTFSIYDTTICSYPYIPYVQYWNIIEKDKDLQVDIEDICGKQETFTLEIKNLEYEYYSKYTDDSNFVYFATANLKNSTKSIQLLDFRYLKGGGIVDKERIEFNRQEAVANSVFHLTRIGVLAPW